MTFNKKFKIPKAPEVEQPLVIRREDVKIRKTWAINPSEKVIPSKKQKLKNNYKYSNKGNLKHQLERELDEFNEEE